MMRFEDRVYKITTTALAHREDSQVVVTVNPCLTQSWVLSHTLGHDFFTSVKERSEIKRVKLTQGADKQFETKTFFQMLKRKLLPYRKVPLNTTTLQAGGRGSKSIHLWKGLESVHKRGEQNPAYFSELEEQGKPF